MISRIPLSSLNLSFEARQRLSQYLDRITQGSNEVLVTPFGDNYEPDEILSNWDKIFESGMSKINAPLLEMELSNRSKFGPRSIAKPWSERRESLLNYFGKSNKGYDLTMASPATSRLRPLAPDKAVSYMKNSTNSGFPFLVKKASIKGKLPEIWRELYLSDYPAMLFTRTQEGGKTRDVWCTDAGTQLYESTYYRPILDIQRRLPWRSALGEPKDVDLAMNKLLKESSLVGLPMISMDFKQYDASVQYGLQHASFEYFRAMYQRSYHYGLDDLEARFNNVGICTPDGIYKGPHGVPSGSTFTNEVDSVAQMLMAYNNPWIVNPFIGQVQGDDGVFISTDPDKALDFFSSFGVIPSVEKSIVNKDYCVYLQNLYHPQYAMSDGLVRGIYPTYRALCRLVFLERFDNFKDDVEGKDYFSIRSISILENCKNHPLHTDLVRYVWSLDKYRLKFSDPGLISYVKRKIEQEGKDVSFTRWTYGDNVQGIKSFKTFKIISELNKNV